MTSTKIANRKVCFVAGGAGFIGTNLVRRLLARGDTVFVADNFSLGSHRLFYDEFKSSDVAVTEVDLSVAADVNRCFEQIIEKVQKIDEVWHLAANSDIPSGVTDPGVDLKDTFLSTYEILKACKTFSIAKFNFASSSAVYGDWDSRPLVETMGPLRPISNYGAMKLASEAQICSAQESYLRCANIFRFPNVVGAPATHGVILDFIKKLKNDPRKLNVLGDGSQCKSYLHVTELIDAMLFISDREEGGTQPMIVNVGCDDDGVAVKAIAELVVKRCSPGAKIIFGRENRGWVGDVPRFRYDVTRLKSLGWTPKLTSLEAIQQAINEIALQENL